MSADINDFAPWTRVAPRGAAVVYHVGNLAEDTHEAVGSPHERVRQKAALAVKEAAWSAYEKGFVALVQRRVPVAPGAISRFEYVAVRI